MTVQVRGIVRFYTGTHQYEFWVDDVEVISDLDVTVDPDIPLEEDLLLILDGSKVLSWKRPDGAKMADAKLRSGDLRIALVNNIDPPKQTEKNIKMRWDEVNKAAKMLQDEHHRFSRGQWTVDVTPYVYLPKEPKSDSLKGYSWSEFKDWIAKTYPTHSHNHWHGMSGHSNSICGLAYVSGQYAWSYCGHKTRVHEQGHNSGLGHAGGDYTVWMSTGHLRKNHNAPQIESLGLIFDEHKLDILPKDQPETVYLVQHDVPDVAVRTGEYKIIYIRHDIDEYRTAAVSYRDNQVHIHVPANKNSNYFAATSKVDSLKLGEEFAFGDILFRFDGIQDYCAKVTMYSVDTENPELPNTTFPTEHVVKGMNPKSMGGVWHNPNYNLQGFRVYPIPNSDHVVVAWLSWEPTMTYKQFWSIFDAKIDSNNNLIGGLYNIDPQSKETKILGEGRMVFTSNDDAIFYTNTELTGRYGIALKRLTIEDEYQSSLCGWWDLGNKNGLLIHEFNGRKYGSLIRANSKLEWLELIETDDKDVFDVYLPEGGMMNVKTKPYYNRDYTEIPQLTHLGQGHIKDRKFHASFENTVYNMIKLA